MRSQGVSSGGKGGKNVQEHLVCGSGTDEEGNVLSPSPAALNAGLLPASRSVWASLIPALVPEHYHGGITTAVPPALSSPRKGGGPSKAKGKKLPQTIADRAKPEAPIADTMEVEMLWDRITALVPPRIPISTSAGGSPDAAPTIPSPAGINRVPAQPSTARNATKPTAAGPPQAQSARGARQAEGLTNAIPQPPLPRVRSPVSEDGSPSMTPSPARSTPQTPQTHRQSAGGGGAVRQRARPGPAIPEEPPIPTEVQVFNTHGIFDGLSATGGIFTVSYPGAISGSSVQPPTTVVASGATARSTANNQQQQPALGSTFVPSHKPTDRPTFSTKNNNGKKPAIAPELIANYGNVNVGTSEAKDANFYTFSTPHAIAAGPHTGSLQVPMAVMAPANGHGARTAAGAVLASPGTLISMISPTVPRLMPQQMVADRLLRSGAEGEGEARRSTGASDHLVPRPPVRARDDGSHPERSAAAQRHAAAERALEVAQDALAASTDRKAGHTMLILYEREVARRERATMEERIEALTAIYSKATEEHKAAFSDTQQRYDTELYQFHNTLNEALEDQARVEEVIADEISTNAALANMGEALIAEIRDHGIALKSLAQEHMQDRAQLTATMTNKLRRTFEEMKAVTATQRAERQGRAHMEANRLGKELTALDRTNRGLTARLAAIKSSIATATRDMELEQQRSALLQSKHTRLAGRVAASVDALRGLEKDLLLSGGGAGGGQLTMVVTANGLSGEIEAERMGIEAVGHQLEATRAAIAKEHGATNRLRGALMDRLQWRSRAPVAFDIMQGLRAALGAEERLAQQKHDAVGGHNSGPAPEPDIETMPLPAAAHHADPLSTLSPAAVQGLLPIGAIIQETLEDVLSTILAQKKTARIPAIPPPPQNLAPASVFGAHHRPSAPFSPTNPLDGTLTSRRSHGGSLVALPQLRHSSISALNMVDIDSSVQILNLDPGSLSNHNGLGLWPRGSLLADPSPSQIQLVSASSAGLAVAPSVPSIIKAEAAAIPSLDINSAPATPREMGARQVRISEVVASSPLAATTLAMPARTSASGSNNGGGSNSPAMGPATPSSSHMSAGQAGGGGGIGSVPPPSAGRVDSLFGPRISFAPMPLSVEVPVATVSPSALASTTITAVRSLLDIMDPSDKRLIQDYVIQRINRRLSQVLPSAPAAGV